jgi:hypothetical protein
MLAFVGGLVFGLALAFFAVASAPHTFVPGHVSATARAPEAARNEARNEAPDVNVLVREALVQVPVTTVPVPSTAPPPRPHARAPRVPRSPAPAPAPAAAPPRLLDDALD